MSEERAAVTMIDLALKAVTLRIRELESGLWQMPPTWRDRVIPKLQHLKERQRDLEARLSRLQLEAQASESGGAEEIFPAVENALQFILADFISVER